MLRIFEIIGGEQLFLFVVFFRHPAERYQGHVLTQTSLVEGTTSMNWRQCRTEGNERRASPERLR